jgi:hypothetical protein
MKMNAQDTAYDVFNLMIGRDDPFDNLAGTISYYHAKRCAIHHCNEMIKLYESSYNFLTKHKHIKHWQSVKNILNEHY